MKTAASPARRSGKDLNWSKMQGMPPFSKMTIVLEDLILIRISDMSDSGSQQPGLK
jgi:hypothetical protein